MLLSDRTAAIACAKATSPAGSFGTGFVFILVSPFFGAASFATHTYKCGQKKKCTMRNALSTIGDEVLLKEANTLRAKDFFHESWFFAESEGRKTTD
jgi:hypothetical protein